MDREPLRITQIIDEARNVKTFMFDKDIEADEAYPGQFVIAWIPGVSEKPYSLSYNSPMGITVKRFDNPESTFTPALFEMDVGDRVWFRGPYGTGFPMKQLTSSKVYMVGGGTGIAPLANLAETLEGSQITSFIGAKSADDLIFEKRLEKVSKVIVTTEDGSRGQKGVVTDAMKNYQFSPESKAAVCGPEIMSLYAAETLERSIDPSEIYVSLERLMKCGIGLCDSCSIGPYTVCQDGPVFRWKEKRDIWKYVGINDINGNRIPDFGKYKKDRCSRKVSL
jgi:dihydroorotate dehydrogenase electron transfer subunit